MSQQKMRIVLKDDVFPEIAAWADELAGIRREIHQHPELGMETGQTAARIAGLLRGWGLVDVNTEVIPNGVVCAVNGDDPGATIGIRADIDALAMNDESGAEWRSLVPGRSHACGHDGHLTWLLGTLRYLANHRDFPGKVVGIFQPAEETGTGAKAVVDAGVLQKFGIEEIVAAHDEPKLDKGLFGFRSGAFQAASDTFVVKIIGKGSHGGRPHQGVDPIPVACQIVEALQTIVSRKVNPIDAALVSVCSFNAGKTETLNVIPGFVTMSGIVRTFNPAVRQLVAEKFGKIVSGIALANDCTAEINYKRLIPAVINDRALTASCVATATRLFGEDHVKTDLEPLMGAEDFSVYQERIPGCILRIGIRDRNHQATLHNPAFDFNDEVLPAACTLLASIATDRLKQKA